MDFSKILFPLKGKLVLEALEEPEEVSGIIIPLEYRERYPQVAKVRLAGAGCSLKPGEIVVLPNEGVDVLFGSYSYWTVVFLILFDEGANTKIQCDADIYPVIRETIESYRRTGEQKWIRVKTIDGETLGFTADEVLDYGLEEASNPGFKLDYLPLRMVWLFDEGKKKLFYFVEESQVLLSLEVSR